MRITFELADGYMHSITVDECRIVNNEIIVEDTDFIAMKFWSVDDVKQELESWGYEPSSINVDRVINTRMLAALDDCTDHDWEIICQAVNEADRTRGLIRKEKKEAE